MMLMTSDVGAFAHHDDIIVRTGFHQCFLQACGHHQHSGENKDHQRHTGDGQDRRQPAFPEIAETVGKRHTPSADPPQAVGNADADGVTGRNDRRKKCDEKGGGNIHINRLSGNQKDRKIRRQLLAEEPGSGKGQDDADETLR